MASTNPPEDIALVGRYRVVQLKDGKVIVGVTEEHAPADDPVHPVKRVVMKPEHVRKLMVALDRHYDLGIVRETAFSHALGSAGLNRCLRFVGDTFRCKYYLQLRVHYQTAWDSDGEQRPTPEGVAFERAYFGAALDKICDFYRQLTFPGDAAVAEKLLEEVRTVEKLTPSGEDPTPSLMDEAAQAPPGTPVPKSLEEVRNLFIARMHGEPGRHIGAALYREYFRHMLTLCYGRLVVYRFERLTNDDLFQI